MQDFYSLEEAAQRLGVSPEQLLQMAKPGIGGQPPEVRSFMDRGSPRFRKGEIDEVARRRGLGSDTEVPLDAGQGRPASPGPAHVDMAATEVFPFELAPEEQKRAHDEDTDIFAGLGASAPQAADSDVRLILEGSDLGLQAVPGEPSAQAVGDSATRLSGRQPSDESAVPLGREFEAVPSDSGVSLAPSTGSGKLPPDSGVRLVEDWLVAKEQVSGSGLSGVGLDKGTGPKSTPPAGPKSGPKVTPFGVAPEAGKSSPKPPQAKKGVEESSSEFELTPLADFEPSDSVFDPSSIDQPVPTAKDHPKTAAKKGDDEAISFELTPDEESTSDTQRRKKAKAAPKPKPAKAATEDSSSEFDLTPLKDADASSSSSEFELSLEDEAGLSPLEETKAAPPMKKPSDVDLKPIEEEDTSTEGSDFELALEEEAESSEGDTGSEVVVIEEEEEPAGRKALAGDVVVEEEGEEMVVSAAEEEEEAAIAAVMAPPAEWGWWGLIHLPTTLLLLFSGFLLLEMMRSIWSYNEPTNPVSGAVFKMINSMFK